MFRFKLAPAVALLFAAGAFACSDPSPVAPEPQATQAFQPAAIQAQTVAGTYLLSFRPTSVEPAYSRRARQETDRAQERDQSPQPDGQPDSEAGGSAAFF